MSKLSAWIKKTGRPFATRARNGKGTVEVQYYDGYVTVRTQQPGSRRFISEIHITRSAWIHLLQQASGPTRLMLGPDFDRYQAERQYAHEEQLLREELRAAKSVRRAGEDSERQRRRYEKAKARRQKRDSSTD